jgi:hypothetical protein
MREEAAWVLKESIGGSERAGEDTYHAGHNLGFNHGFLRTLELAFSRGFGTHDVVPITVLTVPTDLTIDLRSGDSLQS